MGISEATHNKTVEIELAGKMYKLSAFSINDLGEVENFLKTRKLKELKAVAEAAGLVGIEAADYISSKLDNIDAIEVLTSDKKKGSETAEILALIFFCAVRHNHPDIKQSDILPLVNMQNMTEISAKLNEVAENGSNGGKKAQAQAANL